MTEPYTFMPEPGTTNSGRILADSQELLKKLRDQLDKDRVSYTVEPTSSATVAGKATLPALIFKGNYSLGERSAAVVRDFRLFDVWGVVEAGTLVTDTVTNQTYRVGKQDENGFCPLHNIKGGKNTAFESMDPIDHARWREDN